MVIMGEYRQVGDKLICSVACERCGAVVGDLSPNEVAALVSGRYGKVLCFECEMGSCSHCQKELTEREIDDGDFYGLCWFCRQDGDCEPVPQYDPDWVYDDLVFTVKGALYVNSQG